MALQVHRKLAALSLMRLLSVDLPVIATHFGGMLDRITEVVYRLQIDQDDEQEFGGSDIHVGSGFPSLTFARLCSGVPRSSCVLYEEGDDPLDMFTSADDLPEHERQRQVRAAPTPRAARPCIVEWS